MPSLINGRYSVGERVDEGGFGVIRKGTDQRTGNEVILKFEKQPGESTLRTESKIYNAINRRCLSGFARQLYSGRSQGKAVIVLEKLGRSVFDLLDNRRHGFSIQTVAMVAIQTLYRLEALHNIGYLHADIKSDNILIDQIGGKDGTKVFLIDFGNGIEYLDNNKKHVEEAQNHTGVGNIEFSPLAWHINGGYSRKHDLISLLYVMIHLHKRQLPWSDLADPNTWQNFTRSGEMKQNIHPRELCSNMPIEMELFYRHVDGLGFAEAPDYRFLRSLMRDILRESGENNELNFEWLHWGRKVMRSCPSRLGRKRNKK